jgi:hypothetical protein
MPTEAPSPFVRLSPDVVFSREVLGHRPEEEPFSLSSSAVRQARRFRRHRLVYNQDTQNIHIAWSRIL